MDQQQLVEAGKRRFKEFDELELTSVFNRIDHEEWDKAWTTLNDWYTPGKMPTSGTIVKILTEKGFKVNTPSPSAPSRREWELVCYACSARFSIEGHSCPKCGMSERPFINLIRVNASINEASRRYVMERFRPGPHPVFGLKEPLVDPPLKKKQPVQVPQTEGAGF